jgi:membrane protease YdiL (CAAX protease family)
MSSIALRPRRLRGAELMILISVLALMAFYYLTRADTIGVHSPSRGWSPMTAPPLPSALHFVAAALLLGVIPALLARRVTGRSLGELGLGLGRWRQGLALLAVGIPAGILAGKIGAESPAMRAVYPLGPFTGGFALYGILQLLYFGAWEVLFRGVLLFGLKDRVGDGVANALQTALSVTAHFGRALNETFAAFPAGLVFGWVGLRLRSVWYVAVIHWVVGVSLDWFITR